MELSDYEDPADPYAPRPKASQQVAAAKRARQEDDEPPVVTIPSRRYVPFGVGALVLIALMVGAASYQLARLPSRPLAITPPAVTNAPAFAAAPTAAPAPTSAPTAPILTVAMVDAYAAPDGVLLGQIAADRPIVPAAHFGGDWVAYRDGSGLVWLRTSDRPDLALAGPDLAPVVIVPQTGRGLTLAAPTPAPEPPTVPTVPTVPTMPPSNDVLKVRAEGDCNAEHGRCDPPCTAEHGRCAPGDK